MKIHYLCSHFPILCYSNGVRTAHALGLFCCYSCWCCSTICRLYHVNTWFFWNHFHKTHHPTHFAAIIMKNLCYKLFRITIIIGVFKQVCNKMVFFFVFSIGFLESLRLLTNNGKTINKNKYPWSGYESTTYVYHDCCYFSSRIR